MTLSIITTVNDTLKLVFLEGCATFLTEKLKALELRTKPEPSTRDSHSTSTPLPPSTLILTGKIPLC